MDCSASSQVAQRQKHNAFTANTARTPSQGRMNILAASFPFFSLSSPYPASSEVASK